MNFIDTIIGWFASIGGLIAEGFGKLFELLSAPLGYLFSFLDGIFYFITVLFDIIVRLIMIFVALFQFIFAIGAGIFRTIADLLTVNPVNTTNFPSSARIGLDTVIDVISPTGLYDVVPMICLAVVWLGFGFKIHGLLGGQTVVKGGS